MNEKPTRDRSVGFTDASYIRQDDAPNMPRCYSFSEEKSSGTKKTVSPLRVGALCLAFFVLGSLLTTAFSDAEKPVVNTKTAVPTPSSETVQTGGDISGAAAISAAVHADTPPSATSAPTGERPYLGVIVQTVSCAAADYYNGSDSNAMVPGVQIYAVEDGGPASDAGLCSGDIIIRLNGADIATSPPRKTVLRRAARRSSSFTARASTARCRSCSASCPTRTSKRTTAGVISITLGNQSYNRPLRLLPAAKPTSLSRGGKKEFG